MFVPCLYGNKGTKLIPSPRNIHCPHVPCWMGWGQDRGGAQGDPCPAKWTLRQHCWSPENSAPTTVNLRLAPTRKEPPVITMSRIVAMDSRLFFLPLPLSHPPLCPRFLTLDTDQVHFLHCPRGSLTLSRLHRQEQ